MTQLPPTEFTFGRYDMWSGTLPWAVIKSTAGYVTELLKLDIIGYCHGSEIEIRPRTDTYAVMIYDEAEDFQGWCHVPEDVFKAYLETK